MKQENLKEFDKLQIENSRLRIKMALLVSDLEAEEQKKLFKIVNKIVNNEIEQEKLCNN